MEKILLSIGHGYSARALARLLLPMGWTVIGTTRSSAKASALSREGVEPLIWPGGALPIERATHVLTFDLRDMQFSKRRISRNPDCAVCAGN